MSLIRKAAALIGKIGKGSADDLVPLLPRRSRGQIIDALCNARAAGLLAVDQPCRKGRGVSAPSVYRRTSMPLDANNRKAQSPGRPPLRARPGHTELEDEPEQPLSHEGLPPRGCLPKVSSVWELGAHL